MIVQVARLINHFGIMVDVVDWLLKAYCDRGK